jgi:hypothetical protein
MASGVWRPLVLRVAKVRRRSARTILLTFTFGLSEGRSSASRPTNPCESSSSCICKYNDLATGSTGSGSIYSRRDRVSSTSAGLVGQRRPFPPGPDP